MRVSACCSWKSNIAEAAEKQNEIMVPKAAPLMPIPATCCACSMMYGAVMSVVGTVFAEKI